MTPSAHAALLLMASLCYGVSVVAAASAGPIAVYDINIFAVWDSPGGSGVLSAPQTSPWNYRAWGGAYSGNNLPALTNSERLWWPGSSAPPHATTFHVCAWTGNDTNADTITMDKKLRMNLTLTVKRGGEVVKTMSRARSGADIALQMKQLDKNAEDQCGPETAAYVGSYSYRPANKRPAEGAPWLELELSWEAEPTNGQVRLAQTVRGADGQAYEVASDPGRLLVYQDGAWGSVCIDGFPDPARVCRQLGYLGDRGEAFSYGADAASPITVDGVKCGNEASDLRDCEFTFTSAPSCTHMDDTWITCSGAYLRGDYDGTAPPSDGTAPPDESNAQYPPPGIEPPVAPQLPPAEPGNPTPPPAPPSLEGSWTHSCSLVLTPKVQTLACEAASFAHGNITVAIGGALVGRLRVGPGISVTTREPVLPYKRYTDESLTMVADELEASADVGVTFVGVPHLRLVDSVVRGLQLSTGGPLVQCLDCAFLTMDNVTVQDLRGYPLTESYPMNSWWVDAAYKGLTAFAEDDWWGRNGPIHITHGPIHATGLKGAAITNLSCGGIDRASGWGCVLLRLSETLGWYPVRIANSTFANVNVHWGGGYGTMSDASVEGGPLDTDNYSAMPLGFGAVVVDTGRPGVAAVIEVSDSSFVGVSGGLGYGLALINNAMLSLDNITLNRVSFDHCSASLYGGFAIYVQGSVHYVVATQSSFTNGYDGVLAVTRHAELIRMSDCVLADNSCSSEPALFHLGSLSELELHRCSVSRNGGSCGAATILVEQQLPYMFRRTPEPMRSITIIDSNVTGNLDTFFASDLFVNDITLQNSVFKDNVGSVGGVFDLSKPSSGVAGVLVSNCRIVGNSAGSNSWGQALDSNGGFMTANTLGTLTLKDSLVQGNSAPSSGGVIYIGSPPFTSVVVIEDSIVQGNSAGRRGGVVATNGNVNVALLGESAVVNNSATSGGMVYSAGLTEAFEVSDKSDVSNNTAERRGGVLATEDLGTAMIDGLVKDNSARQGAAFFVSGDLGSLAVSGALKRNAAASALGGSIWVGGELGGLSFAAGSTVDGTVTSAEGVADLADVAASGAAAGLRECTSVCHTRPPMPPSPPVYGGDGMPPTYGGDMPPVYGDDSMPPPEADQHEGGLPSLKSRRMRL
ncbi:hypothetical protein HYH03_012964 [Edaphochlamys debaryana]|uniref:SRCR domain-containing protein n=1 Tax=Edaphochlamys debaryana TaxID=47281 RepID=A0A836BUX6_9CHLO|nr:hypothetical protein HYH03_012964 [Edaphochlamys debaryana]|eukprot:KAG2488458.1 hypothetical protein HYH03_012964 [Edaphochlamys debaryana]